MTRKLLPITACALALTFALAATGAAKTPDGKTPAEETVCDAESGAAFGLCNAYCEAMDCDLLTDGDDATSPNASEKACLRVKANWIKHTGRAVLPCDSCPPNAGTEGCPCTADPDCAPPLQCVANMCQVN